MTCFRFKIFLILIPCLVGIFLGATMMRLTFSIPMIGSPPVGWETSVIVEDSVITSVLLWAARRWMGHRHRHLECMPVIKVFLLT